MQPRKAVQGKIVEKKIVCRTDEQIKLVQKLVKENCSSVRGFRKEVNITTEGKHHLRVMIGSKEYKVEFRGDKVQGWRQDIISLAEIAQSQPHTAYIALTKAYQSRFTYFMRTIEALEDYTDLVREALMKCFSRNCLFKKNIPPVPM